MIFVHLFCNNFFLHTYIMVLLSLYIALVSMSISIFLCKVITVSQMIVQITHLLKQLNYGKRNIEIEKIYNVKGYIKDTKTTTTNQIKNDTSSVLC